MYISPEMRDALCNAGAYAIVLIFGTMILAAVLPWLWKRTRYARFRFMMWLKYRLDIAHIRREYRRECRRYKAAMRVFDKPVRWEEK